MKVKTLKGNLKKATIEMILLNLLSEEDMYGYQLTQECKKRSDNEFTILEGSMYPILYRLEEDGFITAKTVKVGKRMTRVYYHLEKKGIQHLLELIQEYEDFIQVINSLINK